jgi:hypothetical protein
MWSGRPYLENCVENDYSEGQVLFLKCTCPRYQLIRVVQL